jgi:hypothetical protein
MGKLPLILLTPGIIARELHGLCGEPEGPFQIVRRYDINDDAASFSMWACGHSVISKSFHPYDLSKRLDEFSRTILRPTAKKWLARKGTDRPYIPLPVGVYFCFEIRPALEYS